MYFIIVEKRFGRAREHCTLILILLLLNIALIIINIFCAWLLLLLQLSISFMSTAINRLLKNHPTCCCYDAHTHTYFIIIIIITIYHYNDIAIAHFYINIILSIMAIKRISLLLLSFLSVYWRIRWWSIRLSLRPLLLYIIR